MLVFQQKSVLTKALNVGVTAISPEVCTAHMKWIITCITCEGLHFNWDVGTQERAAQPKSPKALKED